MNRIVESLITPTLLIFICVTRHAWLDGDCKLAWAGALLLIPLAVSVAISSDSLQTCRWSFVVLHTISASAGYPINLTATPPWGRNVWLCLWFDEMDSIQCIESLVETKHKENNSHELHLPTTAAMKDVLVAIWSWRPDAHTHAIAAIWVTHSSTEEATSW